MHVTRIYVSMYMYNNDRFKSQKCKSIKYNTVKKFIDIVIYFFQSFSYLAFFSFRDSTIKDHCRVTCDVLLGLRINIIYD